MKILVTGARNFVGVPSEELARVFFPEVTMRMEYAPDMCPHTLDILARTLFLHTDPTRSRTDLDAMIEKVRQALSGL